MTPSETIQKLEEYRRGLVEITQRCVYFDDISSLRPGDDSKYLTLIIAITDILNGSLGENQYSPLIKNLHNESITNNDTQSLTVQNIESIIAVIDAAIERLKNNPSFYTKIEEPIKENKLELSEFKLPDRVTLKWLYEHVPYRFWTYLFGLLITAFTFGVAFTKTNLYKSLEDVATAITSANKNTPPTKQ